MLDGLLAKGSGAVIGNVTCAFFHAEEDEEVYVDPPVEWKDERALEGPFRVGNSFVHLKRKRVITPQGVWITPGDTRLKKLLELTGLNIESASRDIRHRPKICQLWLTRPS